MKNQSMQLSSFVLLSTTGLAVSFFESDPILICVYTIVIAFIFSLIIPIILDNSKED